MITKITKSDRERNPEDTKGEKLKLVSKKTGKPLMYGSEKQLKKHEQAIQYFKHKKP